MVHSEKLIRLCIPLQKGLFEDWPQRQRNTGPSFFMSFPLEPLILNVPLTLSGPPAITWKRVASFSIFSTLVSEINFSMSPVAVGHIP